MTISGIGGGLLIILAHGLCSSGLFCSANIIYERLFSRRLIIVRGWMRILPTFRFFWFVLLVFNFGVPPSVNLFAELRLIIGIVRWETFRIIILGGICFISAAYSIYLFSITQHGKRWCVFSFDDISIREYLLLFYHIIFLVVLRVKIELGLLFM
ncbi:hypothetical protein JQN64_24705 [Escherichia coli]|nr:hypothetical protein [Escherichia coli]